MRAPARISAAIGAALAGAGAAIFLHPRSGARNRSAAVGVAKRQSANVAVMVGASMERLPGRGGRAPGELAGSVRAVLAARGTQADGVQVSVRGGTVTLRGEVAQVPDIGALEAAVRSIDEVRNVNNLLRPAATVEPF